MVSHFSLQVYSSLSYNAKIKTFNHMRILELMKFEDMEFEENGYDLGFSATAFHWVPEKVGYEKVYSMLKPGGVFARFANHPNRDKGNL